MSCLHHGQTIEAVAALLRPIASCLQKRDTNHFLHPARARNLLLLTKTGTNITVLKKTNEVMKQLLWGQ